MTLPDERYRAMQNVRSALIGLCMPGRLNKSDLRRAARSILRHYPTDYDLERIAEKCPELLMRPK